jgi:hypothetical protein
VTLPNGPDGVVDNISFGVTHGNGSLPALGLRTQDLVVAALKAEVQASQVWKAASDAVYEGLRNGISFALAVIEAVVQRLFDTVEEFPGVSEALDFIQHVPGVQELTFALTGVTGDLSDLATYVAGKWNTLAALVNDIATFIAAAGQTVIADVGTAIITAADLADAASAAITSLISSVSGTVIGDVGTAITTAGSDATDALSQLNDLIVAAGGVNITDVATAISNAATAAAAATADIVALLADMSAADIHALTTGLLSTASAADSAVSDIADLVTGVLGGTHTVSDLVAYLTAIPGAAISGITAVEQAILDAIANALGHSGTGHTPTDILGYLGAIPGSAISGALNTAVTVSGNAIGTLLGNIGGTGLYNATAGFSNLSTSLLKNLTPTGGNIGQFDASALTGALNTALTIGGQAVSTIFNGSGQFIGVLNSAATGALNTAITISGNALSTVLTNVTLSTGALNAAGITGALNTAVTIGGQAVSALFNGSGQFIGVLNSSVTGALNTAVTVGGNAIGTLLTNINATGQFAGSAIIGAINTAATVGGTAIGTVATNASTAVTNAQGVINGINNAAAGLISGGSTALADAATNVALLFGGAPTYLQGLTGSFGQTATNTAYAAAAAAAAAQAAALAAQTSAFNAVFNVSPATAGNINVTVDFSGMANAANMTGVMSPGNTNLGITSGAAMRKVSTTGSDYEVFPTQTVTDYQAITVTLGPLNDILSSPTSNSLILGRSNSARTTFVYVSMNENGGVPCVSLQASVSGSSTAFVALVPVPTMAAGGVLKLILGDPASSSPYAMQVLYNGTPVITYTDSSHVSQIGASQLYVGLGAIENASGKFPTAIRAVTYQDNPPAPASYPFSGLPTAGTKGRFYLPNDVGLALRDNGTAWERFMAGPVGFHTAPPTSGWSWVNQGGATIATDLGAEFLTAPTSTRNWRLRARTLTPSSNYTATAYIEAVGVSPTSSNRWYTGIGLRNATSGSFITFGPSLYAAASIGAQLTIYRWTNATTFSASSFEQATSTLAGAGVLNWLRIRDDGTNRYFEYSPNGTDWISFLRRPDHVHHPRPIHLRRRQRSIRSGLQDPTPLTRRHLVKD